MQSCTLVKKNLYYDSVTLMRLTARIAKLPGVADVLIGMGTDLNKQLLGDIGLLSDEAGACMANDLLIGILAQTEEESKNALREIDAFVSGGKDSAASRQTDSPGKGVASYNSIKQVAGLDEGYNLAVVSVPGVHAARECKAALKNGMHVFLFSDNVTVQEEVELKTLACEKDLLMMGPDCGTAIIGGVPLGFANVVRRGNIGVAAASGTGLQHVTTLIDRLGAGITHAIGAGGRDLSEDVRGRTMLAAIDALDKDGATEIIVILSKPPSPSVAATILNRVKAISKPVVMCLFGHAPLESPGNIIQCFNIEETAHKAAFLALGQKVQLPDPYFNSSRIEDFRNVRNSCQKYTRGVFCGGTLCDEAMITFRRCKIPFFSNIPLSPDERLDDLGKSRGNSFIDMGDDYFTRGKPHPMIEPSLRNKRVIQDAREPDTAVMLLDVVLGYGSHDDPAGLAIQAAQDAGREDVLWLASIIGTQADPQNLDSQARKLIDAGFVVTESNVKAATIAASLST